MRAFIRSLILVCLWLCAGRSVAQTLFTLPADSSARHHTQATLLLSADTAKPGDTLWAGVDLKMDPGWHTYWKNSGDAGLATEIHWHLPPGVSAGQTEWPLPKKLPPAEVTTYGYEGETVLLAPLTLASNLPAGPLELTADVSWLECKEECIPVKTTIHATLNIGADTRPSASAGFLAAWLDKVPKPLRLWTATAWWEPTTNADERLLNIALYGPSAAQKPALPGTVDFFPQASDHYEIEGDTERIQSPGADLAFSKPVKKFDGVWPASVSGTLVIGHDGMTEGFTTTLPVAAAAPAPPVAAASTSLPPASLSQPLWLMLIYAFIGGLILNIMPCVLPVIALKIFAFVKEAGSSRQRIRAFGAVYALGVLFSFMVLAAVVIGVKAAGHRVGWGMQFGSPVFLISLMILVTLVASNLFGVFEVTLTGGAANAAGELAAKSGLPGAFFNGLLATALATPCTAPILGTALGFAFAQPAGPMVLIFLFIGLGLAAPYLVLSWNPAWLKYLPKPGAWMEKFKVAMGFPMLATLCWLLNIAISSYGRRTLWLGIFLVLVAAAAWVYGEFFQRGRKRRGLALIIVLILLGGGYAYALQDELQWRRLEPVGQSAQAVENVPGGIHWQPWSPGAVAAARADGRPVLVDFTADWCVNCQVNKKFSIEIPSVRSKLKEINAVALVADDTRYPDSITAELQRYGRAGVPLVLVYPKNPTAQPIVLPELLTPGIVLAALDKAAQ